MQLLPLLYFLLAICVVTIHADDSFTKDRDGVVATTKNSTVTPISASSTASSSKSISNLTTSTTTTSSSASATLMSSVASNTFHWNGGEITVTVILLGFIVFGVAFITTWQVRRIRAQRRDNGGLGVYAKHERTPSVHMDVADNDVVMTLNQPTHNLPYSPEISLNQTNHNLERQPSRVSAASSRYSTVSFSAPSPVVSVASSVRYLRPLSPYSDVVPRPSSESTLRRLFSFGGIPRSTVPVWVMERGSAGQFPGSTAAVSLMERLDRESAFSSSPASSLFSSFPKQV